LKALLSQSGATAFYAVIFFNAVIDLGHKITLQNTVFKVHDGGYQIILIAIINALILLPYITLVVPIGRVANSTPKPTMMKLAAWCSLMLTIMITFFYYLGWFWPAMAATLFMAVQSAFYSPAKLSYLKILFGKSRLAASNGLAQAIVITGILLGTVIFSVGFEYLYQLLENVSPVDSKNAVTSTMWPLGLGLITLAIVQIFLVSRIPKKPEELSQTNNGLGLQTPRLSIFYLLKDNRLFIPVLGLSLFWAVGQGMLAAFPAFAKAHAGITNAAVIQAILASSAVGLAIGAFLVARFSRATINLKLVPLGVIGLSAGLWSLTFLSTPLAFLNMPIAFAGVYCVMGISSSLLVVPLNAYIQWQAAENTLGGVIAASNFFQNIAMLLMLSLTIAFALADFDSHHLLQMMAVLTTLVGSVIAFAVVKFNQVHGVESAELPTA
jgi:acyl-[acyl-carrier-protein]-phospholipid O-acyltransferase/long-chain-fatty-acid--[acyl-carrier-protein] ligase